jgi:hypothetical protein
VALQSKQALVPQFMAETTKFEIVERDFPNNLRIIIQKGHVSPWNCYPATHLPVTLISYKTNPLLT